MIFFHRRVAHKISTDHLLLLLALIPVVLFLAYSVSMRDYSVGTDTKTYSNIFYDIVGGSEVRYEAGFVLLVNIVGGIVSSDRFFFGIVFLIVLYGYISSYRVVAKETDLHVWYGYSLLLGLTLLSSWFLVSTTNSIRQGMALPFLYLSIFSTLNGGYFRSILFFAISVSFHFSSLLILPFILLLLLPFNILAFVYLLSSILYFSGGSEFLVKYFSELFDLPLYSFVKNNVAILEKYYGFSLDQYIYTNFWFFVGYALVIFDFVDSGKRKVLKDILSVYMILCLPYFSLGFGGVSNRYAMLAWAFVPLLQTFLILSFSVSKRVKSFLSFLVLVMGVFFYFLKTRGIFY